MSSAKQVALVELGPRWLLAEAGPWTPSTLDAAFGRRAPLLLDVGVGNGTSTRSWAAERADANLIAIEVFRPGIATLLTALDADGPANVRIAAIDALAIIDAAEPASVAGIRVLFPDPWPKRRHVERRLVDQAFVRRAADLLAPGGRLHLATDWDDYADQMRAALADERRLRPVAVDGAAGQGPAAHTWRSARPPRPTTTYEGRGLAAGRTVTDLIVERRPDDAPSPG